MKAAKLHNSFSVLFSVASLSSALPHPEPVGGQANYKTLPSAPSPDDDAALPAKREIYIDDWAKCDLQAPGFCTVHLATGETTGGPYKTAALFDYNCVRIHAYHAAYDSPKLTLKGNLPEFVDINLPNLVTDEPYYPWGEIRYKNRKWFWMDAQCHRYDGISGESCKHVFDCS